jgi:hypothetical protein
VIPGWALFSQGWRYEVRIQKDALVVSKLKSENRLRSKAEQSLVILKKFRGMISKRGLPVT